MTFLGNAPVNSRDYPSFKFNIKLYTFRVTPYTDEEIFGDDYDPNAGTEDRNQTTGVTQTNKGVDEAPVKRKKQIGLTVLTMGSMFGILMYMICVCIDEC